MTPLCDPPLPHRGLEWYYLGETVLLKCIVYSFMCLKHVGSPQGGSEVSQRLRRAKDDEGGDDEESHVVPSFQNAFNEALLSASVSVIAAQSSECVYLYYVISR